MALPKLSQPIFETKLPSSGKKVRFRSFTVKEEKLLLMAQQSGEKQDIANVYEQLVRNCCLDEIEPEKMSAIDMEFFFLQLRAKSVSNIVPIVVTDSEGKKHEVEVDLDKVQVKQEKKIDNKIQLDDKVGLVLRHPTMSSILKLETLKDNKVEAALMMYRECIESIYTDENVYPTSEASQQELDEFIVSMNAKQIEKLVEFLDNMPYLCYEGTYYDGGVEKKFKIQGLENFFG